MYSTRAVIYIVETRRIRQEILLASRRARKRKRKPRTCLVFPYVRYQLRLTFSEQGPLEPHVPTQATSMLFLVRHACLFSSHMDVQVVPPRAHTGLIIGSQSGRHSQLAIPCRLIVHCSQKLHFAASQGFCPVKSNDRTTYVTIILTFIEHFRNHIFCLRLFKTWIVI